jgi:hypothetical protein
MALWQPNATTVAGSEFIGRRLFERAGLRGAQDQKRPDKTFELYHFEDSDREVSVDRLGQTSVDGKVKKSYLNLRGHHAATLMHKKEFHGWAVTKAKELQVPPKGKPLSIKPSPIAAQPGDELSENKYHAHIEFLPEYDTHDMAVRLKYIFERNYHLEPSKPTSDREALLRRVAKCLGALRARLKSIFTSANA